MKYLSRQAWGASPPKTVLKSIGKVDEIFIHHSVTNPTSSPANDARAIQQFHMNGRNYSDIGYTLLVHPDGTVMEGRTVGGLAAQGAHTSGHNVTSIGICGVGNYEQDQPSDVLIGGFNDAIQFAKDKGWVSSSPKIRAHKAVFSTQCCGKHLIARMGEIGTGVPMSADKLTKDEFDYLHILAHGGLPGANHDYRWVGQPLTKTLHEWLGTDPIKNELTLAYQKKNKQLIKPSECPSVAPSPTPECKCDVDVIAEAVAEKLAERLKD
jgi:N-acetylmuramoyl-L-alanine amidase